MGIIGEVVAKPDNGRRGWAPPPHCSNGSERCDRIDSGRAAGRQQTSTRGNDPNKQRHDRMGQWIQGLDSEETTPDEAGRCHRRRNAQQQPHSGQEKASSHDSVRDPIDGRAKRHADPNLVPATGHLIREHTVYTHGRQDGGGG